MVTVFVPLCFFLQIGLCRCCQVYSTLIGNASQHKQDIGQFVCESVLLLAVLEALVAVHSGHQSRHFSCFFYQYDKIDQL